VTTIDVDPAKRPSPSVIQAVDVTSYIAGESVGPNQTIGDDRNTHTPGERAQIDLDNDARAGRYRLVDGSGTVVHDFGTLNPGSRVDYRMPEQPGTYTLAVGESMITRVRVEDTSTDPTDFNSRNTSNPDPIDPSNYAGVVNSDNEEGIAPAPELRKEGVELGPEGATFKFPDGTTAEVGAIEDPDEVARYVDGENAGEVIDADQPASDSDSDSSSSGTDATTSTGDLGPAAAVVALLGLGYAATQR
jgi:hypothetical protein